MKQKILSLLVLLMTAATGAWADDVNLGIRVKVWKTGDTFNIGDAWFYYNDKNDNYLHSSGTAVVPEFVYDSDNNQWRGAGNWIPCDQMFQGGTFYTSNGPQNIFITPPTGKKYQPLGVRVKSGSGTQADPYQFELLYDTDVIISDDSTEGTFTMPAFDATVEYEMVRDMSVQMTAQVGDGTEEQPRYRVQKVEGDYVPADLNAQQVMALFSVTDLLENYKVLTQTTDYTVNIYAIDDQGEPTGDAMTFANFAFEPGHYAVKAVAVDGSYYDGETALSNIFILYEKEITVHPEAIEGLIYSGEPQVLITPAECIGGEMRYSLDGENWSADLPEATDEGTYTVYYKVIADENDDDPFYETVENIVITEMPYEEALAGLFDAIYQAAETLSKGQYVHTEEENDALSAVIYDGAELYAAANKPNNEVTSKQVVDMIKRLHEAEEAYLGEVPTGIENVNRNENDNVNGNRYYDLNGRRVAQPTKGVYILNGKKVVIK